MKTITVEALEEAGYKDCEALFTKIALAGGFGAVSPSHGGGLDVGGIVDAEAITAVATILAEAEKAEAEETAEGEGEKKNENVEDDTDASTNAG